MSKKENKLEGPDLQEVISEIKDLEKNFSEDHNDMFQEFPIMDNSDSPKEVETSENKPIEGQNSSVNNEQKPEVISIIHEKQDINLPTDGSSGLSIKLKIKDEDAQVTLDENLISFKMEGVSIKMGQDIGLCVEIENMLNVSIPIKKAN